MKLVPLLRALRPQQWSKNVFVLAALGFAWGDRSAGHLGASAVERTLLAFVAFCLASSAVYLLNDVLDREKDRQHPEKCRRPIASGELSVAVALAASAVCAIVSFAIGYMVDGSPVSLVWILVAYVALNLAYGLRLKHVVLVDAFCIATGFLLRVAAGGVAAGARVSHWLFLCTLFLALFLALNKRRAEIALLGKDRGEHRVTLKEYTIGFLDQMVTVLAAVTILCYTMYTVDQDTAAKFGPDNQLLWSVPFVTFGIARYMQLVQTGRGGDSPTRIFLGGDPLFLVNLFAWLGAVALGILAGR